MQTMYPAQPNSPAAELATAIDATQTTIEVTDGSKLPDAPNIAVIGTEEDAETIKYETKNGNTLENVTRGLQGTAKAWSAGEVIARNFTAYDYDALRTNIETHTSDTSNPHNVTKSQVGLGNVDNVKQASKAEFDSLSNTVSEHLAEKATLTELGHVNHGVLTATLGTNWSGSEATYTQTISVSEILATDSPIIDVVMSGIYSTDESRIEAWGYIYRAVTADGSITFYATEIPKVEIPIQIKVVR